MDFLPCPPACLESVFREKHVFEVGFRFGDHQVLEKYSLLNHALGSFRNNDHMTYIVLKQLVSEVFAGLVFVPL